MGFKLSIWIGCLNSSSDLRFILLNSVVCVNTYMRTYVSVHYWLDYFRFRFLFMTFVVLPFLCNVCLLVTKLNTDWRVVFVIFGPLLPYRRDFVNYLDSTIKTRIYFISKFTLPYKSLFVLNSLNNSRLVVLSITFPSRR